MAQAGKPPLLLLLLAPLPLSVDPVAVGSVVAAGVAAAVAAGVAAAVAAGVGLAVALGVGVAISCIKATHASQHVSRDHWFAPYMELCIRDAMIYSTVVPSVQ